MSEKNFLLRVLFPGILIESFVEGKNSGSCLFGFFGSLLVIRVITATLHTLLQIKEVFSFMLKHALG